MKFITKSVVEVLILVNITKKRGACWYMLLNSIWICQSHILFFCSIFYLCLGVQPCLGKWGWQVMLNFFFLVCTNLKTLVLTWFVSGAPLLLHLDSLCKRETLELKLVSFWFTVGGLDLYFLTKWYNWGSSLICSSNKKNFQVVLYEFHRSKIVHDIIVWMLQLLLISF